MSDLNNRVERVEAKVRRKNPGPRAIGWTDEELWRVIRDHADELQRFGISDADMLAIRDNRFAEVSDGALRLISVGGGDEKS